MQLQLLSLLEHMQRFHILDSCVVNKFSKHFFLRGHLLPFRVIWIRFPFELQLVIPWKFTYLHAGLLALRFILFRLNLLCENLIRVFKVIFRNSKLIQLSPCSWFYFFVAKLCSIKFVTLIAHLLA